MIKWDVIIEALVMLLIAIITGALVPWFKTWLKTKLSEEQVKNLEAWAKTAVEAAEQIFTNPKTGSFKKSHVLNFLQNVLTDLKIEISEEQLNNIIEAAVYKLKHGG